MCHVSVIIFFLLTINVCVIQTNNLFITAGVRCLILTLQVSGVSFSQMFLNENKFYITKSTYKMTSKVYYYLKNWPKSMKIISTKEYLWFLTHDTIVLPNLITLQCNVSDETKWRKKGATWCNDIIFEK